MSKFKLLSLYLISILLTSLVGCKLNQNKHTAGKVEVFRFDQKLFACKTEADFKNLHDKQPEFYNSFAIDILGIKMNNQNVLCVPELTSFKENYGISMLQHEVDSVFPDLTFAEEDLSIAKQHFDNEFEGTRFPDFLTFISEFTYANVSYDTIIGIGLDMYLGQDYQLYKATTIEFPDFMVRKLRKEYIVPNALKAVGISLFEHQLKDKRFLAFMLFEGKLKYFVKNLQPNLHDTLLFGYSAQQLKWCTENEPQMWAHYIEKKLLYSYEVERYMRYINDGPFTISEGVPQESAPSIGVYTGYRIIEQFAKEEKLSLKEVMEFNNWDEILKKSLYRPE